MVRLTTVALIGRTSQLGSKTARTHRERGRQVRSRPNDEHR